MLYRHRTTMTLKLLWLAICTLTLVGMPHAVQAVDVRSDDRNAIYEETPYYDIVPLGACGDAAGAGGLTLEGKDNVEKAYNYFISQGLTPIQSAGILGNLMQESRLNPKSNQADGPGRGIAQWSEGGRWDALVNWAQRQSLDPEGLDTQLKFMWHEMTDVAPWDLTLPNLKKTTTIEDAVRIFEAYYEKAGIPVLENRIKYAKEIHAALGNGTNNGATSPSGTACGGSGIVVDGYAWPVAPGTKRSYTAVPCAQGANPNARTTNYTDRFGKTSRITTCHHDGSPAFDLMYGGVDGKEVYAITNGRVTTINNNYFTGGSGKPCGWIMFQSTNGTDKSYYWYGHILPDKNIPYTTEVGDDGKPQKFVEAGTRLGIVATKDYGNGCWGGGPHLHIDRGCFQGTNPQTAGEIDCREPTFLQDLQKIWEGLPAE